MSESMTVESFSTFMDRALYDPVDGFYANHRAGGARGDFITSVEVGPLFAALIGERLDRAWHRLGNPAPFIVAELGAGVGTLWRGIARARPACFEALEWHLVERSSAQRESHADLPGDGWRSAASLPEGRLHVVFANELLDNVAFDIVEATPSGWSEVMVATETSSSARRFVLGDPTEFSTTVPVPIGRRLPRMAQAAALVDRCRQQADLTIMIDYCASDSELASRGMAGWMRTFRAHQRVESPLDAPGMCDITADVAIEQLPAPDVVQDQASWLRALGIDARVEQAQQRWRDRAAIADLEAMFSRSAIREAEALTEVPGLGAFLVLEWRQSG